ncbi:hypothetical protein GGF49_006276 [Coemansia sp. RSA 1853]|nr:hypothetical protein LPJ76_006443 [Coemansia sp. RSA 638]KAJ2537622.1 hypothetical protein GGF49_006276 [Coemansia sp. RSA 1853]
MPPKTENPDINSAIEDLSAGLRGLVVNSNVAFVLELKKRLPKEAEVIDEVAKTIEKNALAKVYGSLTSATISTLRPKVEVNTENRCNHILVSGVNKGKNCKNPRTSSSFYCRTHLKKHEDDVGVDIVDGKFVFKLVDKNSGLYQIGGTMLLVTAEDVGAPVGQKNHVVVAQMVNSEVKELNDATIAIAKKSGLNLGEE